MFYFQVIAIPGNSRGYRGGYLVDSGFFVQYLGLSEFYVVEWHLSH